MRFFVSVVMIVLAVALIGFVVNNPTSTVTVTLWNTPMEEVSVGLVVFLSVIVGALAMGLVAVVEGTRIRLENRRLARELHKLETEINFLRTQPATEPRLSDDDEIPPRTALPAAEPPLPLAEPPSAPVYGADREDWPPDDDDDDVYSGGRAV